MMNYGKDRAAAYQDAYSYAMRAAGEDSGMNAAGTADEALEALRLGAQVARYLGIKAVAPVSRSWAMVRVAGLARAGVILAAAKAEGIDAPTGHRLPETAETAEAMWVQGTGHTDMCTQRECSGDCRASYEGGADSVEVEPADWDDSP